MTNPAATLGRLNACSFDQALLLRNRGFEQYFSDMTTTMDGLLRHLGDYAIQPEHSVVSYRNGIPVGFVFLAIKQVGSRKLAWNGGTGVFPEFRGNGIAKLMMEEAERILIEQEVDLALLEVITKNKHAIAAYSNGGFRVVDRLVTFVREGALGINPFALTGFGKWRVATGSPWEVSRLSFYREWSAWECQWHHFHASECLILHDPDGAAAAYALYNREYGADGHLASITLYQCEVAPERKDGASLLRLALSEVFGPFDVSCKRTTNNLSMSNPDLVSILSSAGFEIRFEQYLMIREKHPQETRDKGEETK